MDREEAAKELMAMLEEAQRAHTILRKKLRAHLLEILDLATKYI
jgi:arginine deiminase